jgi:predicted nucleic acid-binding protein
MSSNRGVLADTGFWIAIYDTKYPVRQGAARDFLKSAFAGQWLFPFPLYYEVLRTRFVKKPGWIGSFDRELKRLDRLVIDDVPFREDALVELVTYGSARPLSLVDVLIRRVLLSGRYRVTTLVTTNPADFEDACRAARVEMRTV